MKIKLFIIVLFYSINLFGKEIEIDDSNISKKVLWDNIKQDYSNFYTKSRMVRLGIGFSIGAIIANSSLDQNIRDEYQNKFRNNDTDNFSKTAKQFGNGKIMIPLAFATANLDYFYPDSKIARWGFDTSRAYIVGAPALLVMQFTTGGSRPNEKSYNSQWRPFKDNNGVSGHAFMGAVPFLTISYMYKDNPYIKYSSYIASFATAYSRVNDDRHYFSQALLGWYMAYESVDAVQNGNKTKDDILFLPYVKNKTYGIVVAVKY